MKNRKTLQVLLFISGIISLAKAQTLPETRDTLHLKLNGESTTVLVPHPGKKTTVIFEDTSSLIQVSILKLNKGGNMFPTIQQSNTDMKPALQRTKKWFNEVELGLIITNSSINDTRTNYYQKAVGIDSSGIGMSQSVNNFFMPKRGIKATFNIKETDRPVLKSNIVSFISGYRLYIDYSKASGEGYYYERNPMKSYFGTSYSYNFFNQLVVPLGLAKKIENKTVGITRVEAGITLGLSVKYSFERFKSAEHQSSEGDDITAKLASQAYVKIYRKHLFITFSRDLNARMYGSYRNERYAISMNRQYRIYQTTAYTGLIYFGIGYRFH